MERPKISDYTKDLLASYDQLSEFSCSQDKYIDQLEAEKKELIDMLQGNLNDAYEGQFVMQEFIDEAANLINKLK